MLKYIQIVNYIDICSTAFVRFLNDIPHNYDEDNESLVINLSNPKYKEILKYHLDNEIKAVSNTYGKKTIFIHTCTLKNNWKGYNITVDETCLYNKYEIIDDSLLVDVNLLTKILERKWNDINKKKNVITISDQNIDVNDVDKLLIGFIGNEFVTKYKSDYIIINDINANYYGIKTEDMPEDLVDSIKNKLINYNLLI